MATTTRRGGNMSTRLALGLLVGMGIVFQGRVHSSEKGESFAPQSVATVTGEIAKALVVVAKHREKDPDLSTSERDFRNFDVRLESPSASGDRYLVIFVPRVRPGEPESLGGHTSLGRELAYEVSKKNFEVLHRMQLR